MDVLIPVLLLQKTSERFSTLRTELKGGYVSNAWNRLTICSFYCFNICIIQRNLSATFVLNLTSLHSHKKKRFLSQVVIFVVRNLKTAFRDPLKSRGIYLVDPLADKTLLKRPTQPVKLLSVEALKRALRFVIDCMLNAHYLC
jgi:hypothetical protein